MPSAIPDATPNATLVKFGYPATLIGETRCWTVLLRPQQVTLGALVLVCREEAGRFGAVSPEGFADLHAAVSRIEPMLRDLVGYEKINYLMLMMVDPDVHFHVIPRYAGTRTHLGQSFPDAGWPGPPALGQAVEPGDAVRDDLLRRLRGHWASGQA
ncbi:MAG: HIT family protein [Azospirillum brasilense]|nr:MAG: HIT family protein [Azospirillum brasilense]